MKKRENTLARKVLFITALFNVILNILLALVELKETGTITSVRVSSIVGWTVSSVYILD